MGVFTLVLILFLMVPLRAFGADLEVSAADLRIEQQSDGGYHLFIKAKPGIASVLLVESTKDPGGKADNYAYRAELWNPVNGDEKRLLNGVFIEPSAGILSLIDSTPQTDAELGQAFHVFIPWVVAYGYSWSRNGREFISDGSFINIRTFAKPYADYSGGFLDNPYKISVTQKPFPRPEPKIIPAIEPPSAILEPVPEPVADTSIYMPETLRSFEAIAESGKGSVSYSLGEADIVPVLGRILDAVKGRELDLVICLDTTDSMADDIDAVKLSLPAMVKDKTARFSSFRLGLVLYKDYFEDYVVKRIDFTRDVAAFTQAVTRVRVAGGRDIPEAVYEALYEALVGYDWSAESRMIVLIGDAPAHPLPRGKIDRLMVEKKATDLGISIDVIILPH
jgi:hypothetical protein